MADPRGAVSDPPRPATGGGEAPGPDDHAPGVGGGEAPDPDDHAPDGGADPDTSFPTLGRDGDDLRVVSFGAGGFDTTLQLGVVHALLVIQGRAPDAVVGISAGAMNAVTLAEVLQAGEEVEDLDLPPHEKQARRMAARVTRFRELLDRLFRAPRELLDGLIPDAYQVEAKDPLRPVQSPIFSREERERRDEAVANRAGLVRLYNALLGLEVSFGTITRAVRRVLGWRAAAEIPSASGKYGLRAVEALRLWIIAGSNLRSVSRLLTFGFVGPVSDWLASILPGDLRRPFSARYGSTAGAIIYRFPALNRSALLLVRTGVFLVVATVWVGVTLAPLVGVHQAARWTGVPSATILAGFAALAVFLLVTWGPGVRDFDRTSRWQFVGDIAKSLVVAGGLVALWSGVLLTLVLAVVYVRPWFGGPAAPATGRGLLDVAVPTLVQGLRIGGFIGLAVLAAVALIVFLREPTPGQPRSWTSGVLRRFLSYYQMRRSIFSAYAFEKLFSDLYDPGYWGTPPMDDVLADSLAQSLAPWPGRRERPPGPRRKTVGDYAGADRTEPIAVGITAADIGTGRMEVMDPSTPVVRALLAATAVVPLFPPVAICDRYWVDGSNVSSVAMPGVFNLLDGRVAEGVRSVRVYAASTLPLSRPALESDGDGSPERFASLVDVTRRALVLQRFRDGTLEHRLTDLYSRVMPGHDGVIPAGEEAGRKRQHLRTTITPIEPRTPIELNRRLANLPDHKARAAVLATIAEGCRTSLQVMIRPEGPFDGRAVKCSLAVKGHLERTCGPQSRYPDLDLPGSGGGGPGLSAVCSHCSVHCRREGEVGQALLFERDPERNPPPWPHERVDGGRPDAQPVPDDPKGPCHLERPGAGPAGAGGDATGWPRARVVPDMGAGGRAQAAPDAAGSSAGDGDEPARTPGTEVPLRSLLFSGGVFRGVYQMGVLNALTRLNVQPDLIAGASVGSITAAMTARVFGESDPDRRADLVRRLSAVYLVVDRLILTDRFADFVRNLTVRAADARFSIRQADRVFRGFDTGSTDVYGADARTVLAGLERLLYVNPFEVLAFVKAVRDRRRDKVTRLLRAHAQEWLQRMEVSDEVLGSEPLRRLVDEYVAEPLAERSAAPPVFDDLRREYGIQFLATATNLTRGRLEVLGRDRHDDEDGAVDLREGLLASSAFPGVFRPREAHEVFRTTSREDQYIDGGVMDNLPLDAVAEFMRDEPRVRARPLAEDGSRRPHLVFAASLEATPRHPTAAVPELSWPELMQRTRKLSYNRKIDHYTAIQRLLPLLHAAWGPSDHAEWARREAGRLEPVDIDMVVAKPSWLCGTFAFHPMLGFRRTAQARSIAHGCASTLLAFGERAHGEEAPGRAPGGEVVGAWGLDPSWVPESKTFDEAFGAMATRKDEKARIGAGKCWINPDCVCPYAKTDATAELDPVMRDELHRIYVACRQPKTHGRAR